MKIEDFDFPVRVVNALKYEGIETVEQLLDKTERDLSDFKNLGSRSISDIKRCLGCEGLKLGVSLQSLRDKSFSLKTEINNSIEMYVKVNIEIKQIEKALGI